ncbi:hypothetical protein [Moraxella lacunata]|uniref:hypothetical protein n=1 Tax=Moraxella lacunata TaxID=477 RepID=UPI003EDF7895
MLPKPTADPIAAKIKPERADQLSRCVDIIAPFLMFWQLLLMGNLPIVICHAKSVKFCKNILSCIV